MEGEATARAIRLAKFINTPLYVVHVMSIDAMEEIAKAKREGQLPGIFSTTNWLVSTLESHTRALFSNVGSERLAGFR